jgi:hypothetical protein
MIASAIEKEEKSKKEINLLRATSGNISFGNDCSIIQYRNQLVLYQILPKSVPKQCVLMALL